MKDYLQMLCDYLVGNAEPVDNKKHILRSENAYALASIDKKKGNCVDVLDHYKGVVLTQIKKEAEFGYMYTMITYPSYILSASKEELKNYLHSLGYTVPYSNEDIMIISWKYPNIVE